MIIIYLHDKQNHLAVVANQIYILLVNLMIDSNTSREGTIREVHEISTR